MEQIALSNKPRPVVVIESPFAGDLQTNLHYADCLLFDSLTRGEVPLMGHLLYPRVFDDALPTMRRAGIAAHISIIERAERVIIGLDLGPPSHGMRLAIDLALKLHKPIEERFLGPNWRGTPLCPTDGFGVYPYEMPVRSAT